MNWRDTNMLIHTGDKWAIFQGHKLQQKSGYVPGSKLPLFPYLIGDGHQPNSRGLYTHYKDSLLKVGWPSPIQGV